MVSKTIMLRRISVENFRALREFRMAGLGRVNLLVGTNNCGKTSILEAIHILAAMGQPDALIESVAGRREVPDVADTYVEIGHLFFGHRAQDGAAFAVLGADEGAPRRVSASVGRRAIGEPSFRERRNPGLLSHRLFFGAGDRVSDLGFRVEWQDGERGVTIDVPLVRGGEVPLRGVSFTSEEDTRAPVRFIRTGGLTQTETLALFDSTVLTQDEPVVLDAVHAIEPTIERMASVTSRGPSEPGGIVMMVSGQRIPAGSMGDGITRLLGLALALVGAKGGVLLVDEIDTGLHYTVLTKMWRLVLETAARLDVQVFATTHSRDCYEALAEVAEPGRHDVSLQRIERDKPEAIAYSTGVLRQAAEHAIEVR